MNEQPKPIEPLDLKPILARHAATTQGDWGRAVGMVVTPPLEDFRPIELRARHSEHIRRIGLFSNPEFINEAECVANAEFCAAAHSDVPAMAAEIERLRKLCKAE